LSVASAQALLVLLAAGSYFVPFASMIATRGRASLAAMSILWLGVVAFCARPFLDHPAPARCGLGVMISLIVATLVASGFAVGFVGKVVLLRNPDMGLPHLSLIVAALGFAGAAAMGWFFGPFFV
jgi:hypothetical protein